MSLKNNVLISNIGLSLCSLVACFLVLEFVVFGFILKPDDLLENVTVDGVVRYKPGSVATFRHPGGHLSKVTVNREGWNSDKAKYDIEKTPGRLRIAVVGDSYVHGAFVNVDQGFPNLVEKNLVGSGYDVEVYRFGMDGAPLSQYLHMLRREVLAYRPDVVVVPLIHNDFDQSYRFLKTRYASSFMKLKRGPEGSVVEIAPGEFKPGLADRLRAFSTFRYLYYETGLYLKIKGLVSSVFWGGDEGFNPQFIQSAVDIRKIKDHASNRFFASYVLSEMKKLTDQHGIKLVFVMDGVREAVYDGKPAQSYEVGNLNAIARDVTTELGLSFLDLQAAFQADFAVHKTKFEFPFDWHWNAHANAVVAKEIVGVLEAEPGLLKKGVGAGRSAAQAVGGTPAMADQDEG